MKHKHISVLSLAVFGAASAYSQITLNTVPSRVVGADSLTVSSLTPNLVEGREF
jgi:multisubunit Na+/H+ antiporter MnhF subunit